MLRFDHKAGRLHKLRHRLETHWYSMLYLQALAYVVVLLLWALPIPNPVKVVAVTFHEFSHALAALATGGRVFGFAISPTGSGVTFGIGGNFFLILIAGYIGSSLWGLFFYFASIRWSTAATLIGVELFILSTAYMGWLDNGTMMFGVLSMAAMTAMLWTPQWIQALFLQLIGSACCLYAPLEVMGDVFRAGRAPSVLGYETQSDLAQLSEYLSVHPMYIGTVLLLLQMLLLVFLIRWACAEGAHAELRREVRAQKAAKKRMKELHQIREVSYYRSRGRM